MRWAHLPLSGGLYDQHPGLLDRFAYIFQERGKEQEREQRRNKRQNPTNSAQQRMMGSASRAR